jgi:hypothetical protein
VRQSLGTHQSDGTRALRRGRLAVGEKRQEENSTGTQAPDAYMRELPAGSRFSASCWAPREKRWPSYRNFNTQHGEWWARGPADILYIKVCSSPRQGVGTAGKNGALQHPSSRTAPTRNNKHHNHCPGRRRCRRRHPGPSAPCGAVACSSIVRLGRGTWAWMWTRTRGRCGGVGLSWPGVPLAPCKHFQREVGSAQTATCGCCVERIGGQQRSRCSR